MNLEIPHRPIHLQPAKSAKEAGGRRRAQCAEIAKPSAGTPSAIAAMLPSCRRSVRRRWSFWRRQPGERILDLGCGDGALTALIAERASVLGVDASAEQVAAARARGLEAEILDGARLPFDAEFDAVFSNAALHWMRDADAVIDGVWRALKPGGRFVAECGGAGNVAQIRAALARGAGAARPRRQRRRPLVFPGARGVPRAARRARGFRVLRSGIDPAADARCRGGSAIGSTPSPRAFSRSCRRTSAIRSRIRIEEALADRLRDADGIWTVDYVRLRFAALKPDEAE